MFQNYEQVLYVQEVDEAVGPWSRWQGGKKIIWIAGRRFVLREIRTRCPYNRPVLALSLSITEGSINIGFAAIKICWKICILP